MQSGSFEEAAYPSKEDSALAIAGDFGWPSASIEFRRLDLRWARTLVVSILKEARHSRSAAGDAGMLMVSHPGLFRK